MEIRLTCGGCGKRYRLPGSATGYFKCPRCELVMSIPVRPEQGINVAPTEPVKTRPAASPLTDPDRTATDDLSSLNSGM